MTYPYKYKVGEEPRECACGCGEFTIYPGSKFVHGHHLRVDSYKRKSNFTAPVFQCKRCGKDFSPKKKYQKTGQFCSKSCSSKDRKYGQRGELKGENRNCEFCNKSFYLPPNRIKISTRGKYCSKECKIKDWEDKSLTAQEPGCYRRNAWKVYEKKCYDCGYKDRPEILIIHHIDGNRKNGLISNLIPVCQNCHCIRHIEMGGNHRIPSARSRGRFSD